MFRILKNAEFLRIGNTLPVNGHGTNVPTRPPMHQSEESYQNGYSATRTQFNTKPWKNIYAQNFQ